MSHATNGVSTTTITTSYSSFQQSEGERILGWNVVVIPIFFITLGLLCFSGVISHFRRMNRIRQLQNGVQSIGIVQSSRIEDEQLTVNGVHQYRYYITVEFPVYRLVEDHNDNTTTTATTTTTLLNRNNAERRNGVVTNEYPVTSEDFHSAIQDGYIAMVFCPQATRGLASPLNWVVEPGNWAIYLGTLYIMCAVGFLLFFGAHDLPKCAAFHTGQCIPYWLVGVGVPLIICAVCWWSVCRHDDLEYEMVEQLEQQEQLVQEPVPPNEDGPLDQQRHETLLP